MHGRVVELAVTGNEVPCSYYLTNMLYYLLQSTSELQRKMEYEQEQLSPEEMSIMNRSYIKPK